MLNKKFDFICSIGEDCACSLYIRKFRLQNASYPFDWLTKATFQTRLNLILNEFEDFLNISYFKFLPKTQKITDTRCDYYENQKLDLYFYHDFLRDTPFDQAFPEVKAKYERRIERFYKKIIKSNRVLFIWWSRDKVISDEVLLAAQRELTRKFMGNGQWAMGNSINLLVFENNYDKKMIEYIAVDKHILKVVSNFAFYDVSRPDLETAGNIEQNDKVFSQIKIRRSFNYWFILFFCKLLMNLYKLIPVKSIRRQLRKNIKLKMNRL